MSFYKYFPGNCSSPLSFSVIWFTTLSAFLDWRLCLIILQLELLDLIISLSEQFLPFEFFTCKNISWFLTFQSTFIVKNVNAVPVVIFCFLKYAFSYCSLYLIMIFLKLFLSEEPFYGFVNWSPWLKWLLNINSKWELCSHIYRLCKSVYWIFFCYFHVANKTAYLIFQLKRMP